MTYSCLVHVPVGYISCHCFYCTIVSCLAQVHVDYYHLYDCIHVRYPVIECTAVQAWQDEDTDSNRAEETGHVSKLIPNNEETSRSRGTIHTLCTAYHMSTC